MKKRSKNMQTKLLKRRGVLLCIIVLLSEILLGCSAVQSNTLEESVQTDVDTANPNEKDISGEEAVKPSADELTMEIVLQRFEDGTLREMDYTLYGNGEREEFTDADNAYIHFPKIPYEGEEYDIGVSCVTDENNVEYIDGIYVTRLSDKEMCLIYTSDERYQTVDDLEGWLSTKTHISDWLTLDLPEGYSLSDYDASVGNAGGALIEPQAYEVLSEDAFGAFLPEWTMSGAVGIIPDAQEAFIFEDGQIAGKYMSSNHSLEEMIETLDGLAMPAALYHVSHDLYTAADLGNLEEQGIDTSQIETTSEYWYVFFASEDADNAYYLALDQKQFSKQAAIDIAMTVKFR